MRKRDRLAIAAAALLVCTCVARASWAQPLVVNGGFETPEVPFGSDGQFTSIPGWDLCSGPSIEIQNHCCGSPFEGQQFVEMDSSASSAICQTIPVVPGRQYQLRFAYSPRPGFGLDENAVDVFWYGQKVTQVNADGTGLSDTDWHVFEFIVTATGPSAVLEFADAGISDGVGGYIDAVSVLPASPTPSLGGGGLAIVGLALLGFGFARLVRVTRR